MQHHTEIATGAGSTFFAMMLPDTWLNLGERWLFAVVTAVSATVAIRLFNYCLRKVT